MNNSRAILMQILAVIGSSHGTERFVDDFCTWIKESVFYPYYTGEYMRERLKDAIKRVYSRTSDTVLSF
jgi:hypothetical protein